MFLHHQQRFRAMIAVELGLAFRSWETHARRQSCQKREDETTGRQGLHVDFVGRISADHVQNGQLTARVFVNPLVQLQRIAFVDNNRLALGNQGFDFGSGQELLGRHDGGGCVGERARRRCGRRALLAYIAGARTSTPPFTEVRMRPSVLAGFATAQCAA
jgi:hypothetical protein